MKFDVIGLDSPCVDLAVNVRCFPKPNGAERIQNLSWQGGGKVASGMVAAARLGLCCGIMGNVGDDKYGTFCLRDFQDHGIDTEQMCVRKNRTTNFDIVISDEGSMGRSFVFYPGNAECMTEEELNIEYISNSSYFYMANLDSVTKKAAQMAKQKGSKIFMDADSYTDELLDAISWIDIFIGSEFVYEKMLEAGKSVKENCEYLYNKGPEIVIFTFGEKGCAGISKEGFFEIPAFDVDVKDHLWNNYRVTAVLKPVTGTEHFVNIRVQGAMRSYAAGFSKNNKLVLRKNYYGYTTLCETDFEWKVDEEYKISLTADGSTISVSVNDKEYLKFTDSDLPLLTGCAGISVEKGSHCLYRDIAITGRE